MPFLSHVSTPSEHHAHLMDVERQHKAAEAHDAIAWGGGLAVPTLAPATRHEWVVQEAFGTAEAQHTCSAASAHLRAALHDKALLWRWLDVVSSCSGFDLLREAGPYLKGLSLDAILDFDTHDFKRLGLGVRPSIVLAGELRRMRHVLHGSKPPSWLEKLLGKPKAAAAGGGGCGGRPASARVHHHHAHASADVRPYLSGGRPASVRPASARPPRRYTAKPHGPMPSSSRTACCSPLCSAVRQ